MLRCQTTKFNVSHLVCSIGKGCSVAITQQQVDQAKRTYDAANARAVALQKAAEQAQRKADDAQKQADKAFEAYDKLAREAY